jgi:hypothetical protein
MRQPSERRIDIKRLSFGCHTGPSAIVPIWAATVDTSCPQLERTPPVTVVTGTPELVWISICREDLQTKVAIAELHAKRKETCCTDAFSVTLLS